MRKILFLSFLIALASGISAQDAWWVFFTDKPDSEFNPYEYFDEHCIEKRIKLGIPLVQVSDLPVTTEYIEVVDELVIESGFASRWFNALAVKCDAQQIPVLLALPFVSEVIPMQSALIMAKTPDYDSSFTESIEKRLKSQLNAMGYKYFQSENIDGSGVRIAIFDAGFTGADISPAFHDIRESGRLIATWDFKKKTENVFHGHTHGTSVWSCIGGYMNDQPLGMATGAEFLLARTEGRGEFFVEETNWLAALEWADKHGADIINSSLGYTYHRYFPDQMDGKISLVSRAATMAARKGILVVNAAGNEGTNSWKYIGAPADADSILSVGGINPGTGTHTSFSSYGPTSDGRMKPNVTAYGHVAAASKNRVSMTQGTSFSSPLTAGFAACAWQAFPDDGNIELLHRIEKSGSLYPYFDYAHGYGVPQADRLLGIEPPVTGATFQFGIDEKGYKIEIENDANPHINYPGVRKNIFIHVRNSNGMIRKYWVIDLDGEESYTLPLTEFKPQVGDRLYVYYRGWVDSMLITDVEIE